MGVYRVEVEVALARPPRADATVYVVVEAPDGDAAELVACHVASTHPRVVMPVGSVVTDWPDDVAADMSNLRATWAVPGRL